MGKKKQKQNKKAEAQANKVILAITAVLLILAMLVFFIASWVCKVGQEIERKFLVAGEYKDLSFAHSHIAQGYICSAHGRMVRIRIRGEEGYLTIKGPSEASGLARYEWEKAIPLHEALELMKICEPGIIDKTRWLVKSGKHTFEVDEFHGENQGLVIAEVELAFEEEPFLKPPFIGREVTGDARYYNSYLTKHPFCSW